jgi:hypothetical protein
LKRDYPAVEMAGRGNRKDPHSVARHFELYLGPTEFVILHFQLDLMNLQLVHQLLHVLARHARNVMARSTQPLFRLPAEWSVLR